MPLYPNEACNLGSLNLVNFVKAPSEHTNGHTNGHAKVAAMGFCTGASLALLTSASSPIDATVAYYGIFEDHAHRKMTNPVLIHLAEHEEYYPSADRFRAWFAGMSNVTIHVYPGTRHAFFDETVPLEAAFLGAVVGGVVGDALDGDHRRRHDDDRGRRGW